MVLESAGVAEIFLAGRVLFGAVLAFMGLNHFLNGDQLAPYAEAKGIPAPSLSVGFSGGMLLFGGLSVAAGVYPVLGAGALAVFLLVTTPVMHDFWAAAPEDQQTEMTQFLKNLVMLGGSLALLALATEPWPYAVGIGL
jgi:uncharacterized membrane protein YphA (DoxX/SURF4 family)